MPSRTPANACRTPPIRGKILEIHSRADLLEADVGAGPPLPGCWERFPSQASSPLCRSSTSRFDTTPPRRRRRLDGSPESISQSDRPPIIASSPHPPGFEPFLVPEFGDSRLLTRLTCAWRGTRNTEHRTGLGNAASSLRLVTCFFRDDDATRLRAETR